MSHFYLTLPSNSSFDYYPQNTLTRFTTKLHEEVTLQGDWEVGLSEIMYSRSWYNVSRSESLTISCSECSDVEPEFSSKPFKRAYSKLVSIHAGYYKNMETLIEEINNQIELAYANPIDEWGEESTMRYVKLDARPTLMYNAASRKVYIRLQGWMTIKFSQLLSEILGFTDPNGVTNSRKKSKQFRADRISDIECGLHSLYIYCDILECVPVGDTVAPLLRIIDVQGEHGFMVHRYFERPRYIPIQKKHFGSLEIHIKDSYGQRVPFENGSVIVTLHFKRAKTPYFLA